MHDRGKEGALFAFLLLGLSTFLAGHSLAVAVDSEICFENLAESVNGSRPNLRVADMPLGDLVHLASQVISLDQLITGILGLFPLSPFLVAWALSGDKQTRLFWIGSALISTIAIVTWVCTRGLEDYYDCDLSGIGLGILAAPIIYMVINLVATPILASLRSVTLLFMDRG